MTKAVIHLASNENCYGPSPLVKKAILEVAGRTNRYPDPNGLQLRETLSARWKVSLESVILGNGSSELVEIIARAFLQGDQNAITALETFVMYKIATDSIHASCLRVPLENAVYDLSAIARQINEKTRVVFIANPNNPTGTIITKTQLETFLKEVPRNVHVVLDEAYIEYVSSKDFPNGISYLVDYPNLIVLRTFSKVYSLAGLRIGYAIADRQIIAEMNRVHAPYNASLVAQAAALAALQDTEHVARSIESNQKERAFLNSELYEMGIPFLDSQTNFILLKIPDAHQVAEKLLEVGIYVRPMDLFNLPQGLRVTIGTHDENIAFLKGIKGITREIGR